MMTLLIGIIIGAVLGLTGAGGSIFAVPLLLNLLDVSMQQAIGLSLGAVASSALIGTLARLNKQQIQWLPALVYASIGGLIAPLGNWLNHQLDEKILLIGFTLLLTAVAIHLWRQASKNPQSTLELRAGSKENVQADAKVCELRADKPFQIGLPCALSMAAAASITGLLSGLFGVGGGFLIVPTLLLLTGVTITQAIATSLAVITIVSGSGFIAFLWNDQIIDTSTLLALASGGFIGMVASVRISRYLAGPVLQKLFVIAMIIVIAVTLFTRL